MTESVLLALRVLYEPAKLRGNAALAPHVRFQDAACDALRWLDGVREVQVCGVVPASIMEEPADGVPI